MAILTAEQLKAYCRNEIPTEDQEWFDILIEDVDDFLSGEMQRNIAIAGSATAQVFVPNSWNILRIYDCTSVTSILNDGSAVAAADYQLEPVNGKNWAGESRPYEQVRLLRGQWWTDGGKATVTVTATWGWAAIPPRITQAALMVGKELATNRDVLKLGIAGFVDPVARETVANTINRYRRVESFGVA